MSKAKVFIMNIPLMAIEVTGFLSFLYVALRLLSTYRKFRVQDLLLSSTSFLLLSVSQLCAALSIVFNDVRVSASLYVATSSLAMAAFILMIVQRSCSEKLYTFTPYIVFLIAPDVVAGSLSIYIAIRASGYIKMLLIMLSSSYYLRVLSVIVGGEITPIVLLVAELIRSLSAVALAIYSSVKVFKL